MAHFGKEAPLWPAPRGGGGEEGSRRAYRDPSPSHRHRGTDVRVNSGGARRKNGKSANLQGPGSWAPVQSLFFVSFCFVFSSQAPPG